MQLILFFYKEESNLNNMNMKVNSILHYQNADPQHRCKWYIGTGDVTSVPGGPAGPRHEDRGFWPLLPAQEVQLQAETVWSS